MERLTTDSPQTNMEILANFAYAKDKEVRLIYGDGLEDVALADYIVEHAKSDFECYANREDVINGDNCWECDCPLAVLNAVATQAAELRAKLKKYEDAEGQGRLILLPFKVGDTVYYIKTLQNGSDTKVIEQDTVKRIILDGIDNQIVISYNHSFMMCDFNRLLFLSREEAEKALERTK